MWLPATRRAPGQSLLDIDPADRQGKTFTKGVAKRSKAFFGNALDAYASILFLENRRAGFVLLLLSLIIPAIGIAGFLAMSIAYLTVMLFGFSRQSMSVALFNAILFGYFLGASYQLDAIFILSLLIGSILIVFVTAGLSELLWRLGHLPVLAMPFMFITALFLIVLRGHPVAGSGIYFFSEAPYLGMVPLLIKQYLYTLSSVFFSPYQLTGLVLFLCITFASRYLAILAVAGYAVGISTFLGLSTGVVDYSLHWVGLNVILTSIALGGIFVVPGRQSFALAMLGAAIAAVLTCGVKPIMSLLNLPILIWPFVLTTLLVVYVLRTRITFDAPYLLLEQPGMPEKSYERMRLSRARLGDINSVPLTIPVLGEWQIYQGINGTHTHTGLWKYAMDFFIEKNGQSYRTNGFVLEDYYCFGLPVISPAYGQVVASRGDLPDNPPGEVDTRNNWGNYILIRLSDSLYVILSHLKQNSLLVNNGVWVAPGDVLAHCGNSGRSLQPHLHLHVQSAAALGSATYPFHLVNLILRDSESKTCRFFLNKRPNEGDMIQTATIDQQLAHAMRLAVGRCYTYRLQSPDSKDYLERTLTAKLTSLGQFRLVSDNNASAAFENTSGVLAFYDRDGAVDVFFDMWLLAVGFMPFSKKIEEWRDAPTIRLLPLDNLQRFLSALLYPLGTGLDSRYKRYQDPNGNWRQDGEHQYIILNKRISYITQAIISPDTGCVSMSLTDGKRLWRAELQAIGQVVDNGIPAWKKEVAAC